MRRAGTFQLLICHGASRLKSGLICVEDIDSFPFVTNLVNDPEVDSYTFQNPCPNTAVRIARFNADRALRGEAPYTGVPNLGDLPDRYLKLASPNADEVKSLRRH